MTITLKLSTGKEIELTSGELEELKSALGLGNITYAPQVAPNFPSWPWSIPSPPIPPFYITCKSL